MWKVWHLTATYLNLLWRHVIKGAVRCLICFPDQVAIHQLTLGITMANWWVSKTSVCSWKLSINLNLSLISQPAKCPFAMLLSAKQHAVPRILISLAASVHLSKIRKCTEACKAFSVSIIFSYLSRLRELHSIPNCGIIVKVSLCTLFVKQTLVRNSPANMYRL